MVIEPILDRVQGDRATGCPQLVRIDAGELAGVPKAMARAKSQASWSGKGGGHGVTIWERGEE